MENNRNARSLLKMRIQTENAAFFNGLLNQMSWIFIMRIMMFITKSLQYRCDIKISIISDYVYGSMASCEKKYVVRNEVPVTVLLDICDKTTFAENYMCMTCG